MRIDKKALNLSCVFRAKAEFELNVDATCQKEPLVGNPITSNPIGPVVRAQHLVATLSLSPFVPSWHRPQSCLPHHVVVAAGP